MFCVGLFLIYGGYFWYMGIQFQKRDPEGEAFRILTNSILDRESGGSSKYVSVGWREPSTNSCSFWLFEAVLVKCRGGTILVKNFSEEQRAEVVTITNKVAIELAAPCRAVRLMPSNQIAATQEALGCGKPRKTYKLNVQAVSSTLEQNETGGGIYRTKLIFESTSTGEIS